MNFYRSQRRTRRNSIPLRLAAATSHSSSSFGQERVSPTVDFAPVAQRHQFQFVSLEVKLVDDTVIPNPEAVFGPSLEATMGVALQPPSQFADLGLDPLLQMRWESAENGVELVGVDLGRLVHGPSPFLDPHATRTEVGLATLDAGHELLF
jgi:hypothetical protein